MKNRIIKAFLGAAFAFVFFCGTAFAISSNDKNVFVSSKENIPTDFIYAKRVVDVAGNVNGDVIVAGANVSFSGNAAGDVLAAGGTVRSTGNSAGDVRVVGGNVTLDGSIGKNVTVVGGTVIVDEGTVVGGNLYVAGGNVEIRGTVNGNVTAYGSQIIFSGKVNKNADLRSSEIIIRDDAKIGGDLTYASSTEIAPKEGVVQGRITKTEMPSYNYNSGKSEGKANVGLIIWQFLSLFIVAAAFFKIFPKQVKALIAPINKDEVWNRIATGIISFLLNPLVIFITFITLIGMPLALMILFAYVVLIIAAATLSPILLGRLFNDRFKLYIEDDKYLWKNFVIGYFLMQILGLVPVLGDLALIFLFLFSFGRITQYITGAIKANR